jgi:hypothetical protein
MQYITQMMSQNITDEENFQHLIAAHGFSAGGYNMLILN